MKTNPPSECHITVHDNTTTAVDHIATASGLSKQKVKQAMQKGAVWLTQGTKTRRLRRASKLAKPGDSLHLYYNEHILAAVPSAPTLIADETAYSVWYKPCGMLSQGSKWGDHCTITRWVEQNLKPQRPCFVIHRLDRAATGLILVGHQKRSAAALSKLFQLRELEKHYRVIVHGQFPTEPATHTFTTAIDGRSACSHVRCLEYNIENDQSLLEVVIESGRKHQIRRHLSEAGFAVVGDRIYGQGDDSQDLQLTACYLAFNYSDGNSKVNPNNEKKQYRLPDELIPSLNIL